MSFHEWLEELGEILGGYEPDELLNDGRRDLLSMYNRGISPKEASDLIRFVGVIE